MPPENGRCDGRPPIRRKIEIRGGKNASEPGSHYGKERGIMAEKELPQTDNPPELLKPDDFFDKYRIVSFIGRGGMSEVYLAEHLLLKQFCALKIMTDPTGGRDPEIFSARHAVFTLWNTLASSGYLMSAVTARPGGSLS